MSAPLPLEDAVAVLARIAASSPRLNDHVALHLSVTRALDAFAARGLAVAPERIVPRVAAAFADPTRSVLDLMIAVLVESERASAVIVERARDLVSEAAGVSEEAAHAHAIRRVLLDPAGAIDRYLPRDVVLQNDFCREELVRAWASAIDVPIEIGSGPEPPEKSRRILERLDYRKIRADEERLGIERRVLAEHAEAVREKQRREAEAALASAQRE